MKWLFQSRLRHPLFPTLVVTFAGPRISRCAVLAGRIEDLRRAAVRGTRVTRSVCVVSGLNELPLRNSDRAALWHWFQVPVYRMLLDPTGRLAGSNAKRSMDFTSMPRCCEAPCASPARTWRKCLALAAGPARAWCSARPA